jgi:alanine-synthesizing transaminase
MSDLSSDFYRIQKLPPYVFAVINEMKAKARAAQLDVDYTKGNLKCNPMDNNNIY